jgi:hypothetical protein
MSGRDTIAFVIYFVCVLGPIGFGVLLLFCKTILPYHKKVMNMTWEDLGPGLQVLLQCFTKIAAAGFLVNGLAVLILLFIPFRQGEQWAHWAIPLLLIILNGFGLYCAAKQAIKTHVGTPWPASVLAIIMAIVAFILSPGFG